MTLELIANRVLDAVDRIEPETRWEEKADPKTGILGTNSALRTELAGAESFYAGCNDRCDIVFAVEGVRVWLEAKHSWTWGTYRKPGVANRAYRKHLLGTGGASVLHDAQTKLPRLIGQPGVDMIAMLLIALGSTQLPHSEADVRELARLARLDVAPWLLFRRPGRASKVAGYESILVRPYLWIRSAAASA